MRGRVPIANDPPSPPLLNSRATLCLFVFVYVSVFIRSPCKREARASEASSRCGVCNREAVIDLGLARSRLALQDDGEPHPAFNSFSRWMISVASRK